MLGCQVGDEGASSIAEVIKPRPNMDGSWAFNPSFSSLQLTGTVPNVLMILALSSKASQAHLLVCQRQLIMALGYWTLGVLAGHTKIRVPTCVMIGNAIEAEGMVALADALQPRRDDNGYWTFNPAITAVQLGGTFLSICEEKCLALHVVMKLFYATCENE